MSREIVLIRARRWCLCVVKNHHMISAAELIRHFLPPPPAPGGSTSRLNKTLCVGKASVKSNWFSGLYPQAHFPFGPLAYIATDRFSFRLSDPACSGPKTRVQIIGLSAAGSSETLPSTSLTHTCPSSLTQFKYTCSPSARCQMSRVSIQGRLPSEAAAEDRLLRREGFTVQVSVNDYLDIYCPHYNSSQRGTLERVTAEQYILYMVSYRGYRTCDPQLGFKRWECNRPHAPHAPIKFSEKFQRYSAFSLGYEFTVGQEYYYISTPTHHHGHSCLRLRVYVCCSTALYVSPKRTKHTEKQRQRVSQADDDSSQTSPDYTVRPNIKIHNLDEFNPEVPKLEKSVSGSSQSRDRLLLTMAMLLLSSALLS
ncbi:unnamed protein product [Pleuronectes platessa]|uniref:Ephrin RBD domain-containing protein n=1 Tax=Pleuronectes platessa TaxID=8262 RepID=A0A9N7UFC9_PLEPL|nr:unnamed protein product [Pleuronectes platessa]